MEIVVGILAGRIYEQRGSKNADRKEK